MANRTQGDEPGYLETRGSTGRLVEILEAPVERVRKPSRRQAPPDGDSGVQRVGGRHRFRSEILLVLIGLLFLTTALLKPWTAGRPVLVSATPTGNPTAAVTGEVAVAATTTPTPLQSPIGWPDVPQWDYGWPVPDPTQSPAPGSSATIADPRWAAVDWTVLSTVDPHNGWGYAAAIMPDPAQLPQGATIPPPRTSWAPAGTPRLTTINVARGNQIFGLAVTWPRTVHVVSVTVGYIGGPQHPANLPPAGFPAFAQVSPLPASQVAASPSAATSRQAVGASGVIGSGQFWIPPSGSSLGAASLLDAWRSQPWPWPDGIYNVSITTTTGQTSYLLTLQTS
jgi:hypothetical protein